jgi:hypothetical protein
LGEKLTFGALGGKTTVWVVGGTRSSLKTSVPSLATHPCKSNLPSGVFEAVAVAVKITKLPLPLPVEFSPIRFANAPAGNSTLPAGNCLYTLQAGQFSALVKVIYRPFFVGSGAPGTAHSSAWITDSVACCADTVGTLVNKITKNNVIVMVNLEFISNLLCEKDNQKDDSL